MVFLGIYWIQLSPLYEMMLSSTERFRALLPMLKHVYSCLHNVYALFARVYLKYHCLLVLVQMCLTNFTHLGLFLKLVYPFACVYLCLLVFTCLIVFTYVYQNLLVHVYQFLPFFTRVYLCLIVFEYICHCLLVFFYFYTIRLVFTPFNSCLCVFSCLPMYTRV